MKRTVAIALICLVLLALGGCQKTEEAGLYTLVETDFGAYDVPPGWNALEEDSTESKAFYVSEDYNYTYESSNIIVEHGENDYYAAEYNQFMDAVSEQLSAQVARLNEDADETYIMYGSDGFGSDKGNRVLVFEVEGPQRTVQFYICGDHEYVLVQSTQYGDKAGAEVEEAALKMAQSFEWNE